MKRRNEHQFRRFFYFYPYKISHFATLVFIGLLLLLVSQQLLADWPVLNKNVLTTVEKEYGLPAKNRLLAWKQLIDNNKNKAEMDKLILVNQFFNQLPYSLGTTYVGKTDYWKSPLQFLVENGGECKDFAIAKYFTLRAMGVGDEKLRITYVKSLTYNQPHMILAYYATPEADPLILDNLIPEIKPGAQRNDLVPVYSFNGGGLWLAKQRGQGQYVSGPERLGPWVDLTQRMLKEPIQEP